MKNIRASLLVMLFAGHLSGCASIVSGTTQSVAIAPLRDGGVDSNTSCTVSNGKGSWVTNGGGSVTVKKSREDLQVKCIDLSTNAIGMQAAPRSTQVGWAVVNFFLIDLCTISCLFDFGNGSIYQYPSQIQVAMPSRGSPAYVVPAQPATPQKQSNEVQVINGGVSF